MDVAQRLRTQDHRHRSRPAFRLVAALAPMLLLVAGWLLWTETPAQAAPTLPAGFQEEVVFSGLDHPTVVRFAADGRVFVAEKRGIVKVFASLSATTPTIFADLRTNVHNYWDRGLSGMTLDPNFPTQPYVYVLYSYDAAIGGTAPRWGSVGGDSDGCPNLTDGCVASGRLSRLQAAGSAMTGSEQVLIEDWCQQFPFHTVDSLVFGADGALYASAGAGDNFNYVDYGQTAGNPCGDPPVPVGGTQTAPTAEGGSLRSQSLQRPSGEPISLDGTILRVDPATGAGKTDNPLAGSSNANARRIIAYGLRNPFRITTRPGTNEIWIGDVGWNDWEEINVISNPTSSVQNFGWPCYEGNARQTSWDAANLNICETLYSPQAGAVSAPFYAYHHTAQVVPNETCPTGSSSITGLAFVFNPGGGSYPSSYDGALFFADHSRNCIWTMFKDPTSGQMNKSNIKTFVAGAANPVELVFGPGGQLYYVDHDGGTIRRIVYGTTSPTSCTTGQYLAQYYSGMTLSGTPVFTRCEAAPINYDWGSGGPGNGVGTDNFSARWAGKHSFAAGSYTFTATADDGIRVWLDGASIIDAWKDQGPTTYTATRTLTAGDHDVKVEYYENTQGAVAKVSWQAAVSGNQPPKAVISTPVGGTTWKVGDTISFSGSASDPQDGTLPPSALTWTVIMHHCPSNCHTHIVQSFSGVRSGSFVAPDHEYPSYLELQLTATDSGGLTNTASLQLDPKTVVLRFESKPGSGFQLAVGGTVQVTAFNRTVIVGSSNSISAITPQTVRGQTYQFDSWSDGGAQTHTITAPAAATTYAATFRKR